MNEQEIKKAFSKKLVHYRKSAGLTQTELAEKLNYSDKSVSKWERGEGLPDVLVLASIAEIFGIKVDDLINEKAPEKPVDIVLNRRLITWIAIGIPWFIASIVTATLIVANVSGGWPWISFLYAVPCSAIVAIVFTSIWWSKTARAISVSILLWSVVLCGVLTVQQIRIASFFMCAAVLQIIIILSSMIKKRKEKNHIKKTRRFSFGSLNFNLLNNI